MFSVIKGRFFELIINGYVKIFGRSMFEGFNRFLHRLSLGGLGILNYKTPKISGEKNFLLSYLSGKEGVVIDAGANRGSYTLNAISSCDKLVIYAFEPHPTTFVSLCKSVNGLINVIPKNIALGSCSGTLKLYDYPTIDGSEHATLFQEVITDIHGSVNSVSHSVRVLTLDEFLTNEEIKEVLLLKIDTEGNELDVLMGAANALKQKAIKAIHIEFNEMNVVSRVFFRDFWKLLDGYKVFRLLPNEMLEIKKYSPINCEIFAYQNIVAILNKYE